MIKNLLATLMVLLIVTPALLIASPKAEKMNVKELLLKAETLVDKDVYLEGKCEHVCRHSGMKMKLYQEDGKRFIKAISLNLGKFNPEANGKNVSVKGTLRKSMTEEEHDHGHEEKGEEDECSTVSSDSDHKGEQNAIYWIECKEYKILK